MMVNGVFTGIFLREKEVDLRIFWIRGELNPKNRLLICGYLTNSINCLTAKRKKKDLGVVTSDSAGNLRNYPFPVCVLLL